jgi:hypothetical protein
VTAAARHRRIRPRPDPALSAPARSAATWAGFWAVLTTGLSVLSAWWWLLVGAALCAALAALAALRTAATRRPGGAA